MRLRHRRRAGAERGAHAPAAGVERDLRGRGDHREIAVAQAHFVERAADARFAPYREADLDESSCSGPIAVTIGARMNFRAGISRAPEASRSTSVASSTQATSGSSAEGSACTRRAADGAAVARLRVAHPAQRLAEERHFLTERRVALDGALAHRRAERHGAVAERDLAQVVRVVDVDQERGTREAHRHHRDEALPAGDQPGVAAVLGEQRAGFGGRARAAEIKRNGLHPRISADSRPPRRFTAGAPR